VKTSTKPEFEFVLRRFALVPAFVLGLGLSLAPGGCKDPGSCDFDKADSCENGQACQLGVDGEPGCFCSSEENLGCEDGLDCYAVDGADPSCLCSVDAQTGCGEVEACELIPGAGAGCFPPVTVSGMVFDLQTNAPVVGALVVARDANNASISGVAVTDASGAYTLEVPTPRTAEGELLPNPITLRADAAGYLTFPSAPRTPVPVDTGMASGDPLDLSSSATDVGLIPIANPDGLGTITGKVLADRPRGTLVVAGGSAGGMGGGVTGIADYDGTYTVFNVPVGSVAVSGYKLGLQLEPNSASVAAGATASGVDLADLGEATAIVDGKVEIVNPGDGEDTSVILVVDETFNPTFASGEAPPGLRIWPVSGDFTLEGVPDGNYVVLAAFENDFLVRDPDTSIGGTSIVRITVAGADMTIDESFKITGSLNVLSPDAEQVVSGTPTFVWSDDSGEDHYEVVVYDAFGNLVWEKLDVPGVSGGAEVSVPYEGPALQSGLLYQFRATSIKQGGTPLARTEDLRGVFVYQ
jgi:hypothetical protein